jgi:hypothetical protein
VVGVIIRLDPPILNSESRPARGHVAAGWSGGDGYLNRYFVRYGLRSRQPVNWGLTRSASGTGNDVSLP